jgi:hypothetical protein
MTLFRPATGEVRAKGVTLEKGARMDVFAAAMLGQLEIVQAILKAFSGTRELQDPHGIPLLDHAKAGGEEAAVVAAFLQATGLA